jgi:probable blue pigment (indigoidine) exporter
MFVNIERRQYSGRDEARDRASAATATTTSSRLSVLRRRGEHGGDGIVEGPPPIPRSPLMLASSTSRSAVLALILAAASWGLGTVVAKRAVAEITPLTLLAIQLTTSLLVLAILMRWRGLAFRDPSASPVLGRLGVLNPGIAYAFSLLGLVHISASLSVLLWAMEPLLILLLAAWLLRERVGAVVVLLSFVAVAGMTLVIYQPDSTGTALGVALTLAGVVCCAVYTIITRRWISTADSTAQVVVAQQAHALAFALVVVAALMLVGGITLPVNVSLAGWASAAVSGLLYYGLAYWFYLSGLREMRASIAAATFYLIPVFGVAGGLLLLGERLSSGQWLGVAIVAGAVVAILRRTNAVPDDPAAGALRAQA